MVSNLSERHDSVARRARVLLVCLLLVDLGFILFDLFAVQLAPADLRAARQSYSIFQDGGLPEMFQYGKWAAVTALLLWLGWRSNRIYFGFAVAFLVVLADDSMRLHEQFGHVLMAGWTEADVPLLRPQDFGELGAWAILGALILGALLLAYRGADAAARRGARPVLVCFVLLILVGIGGDQLHMAIPRIENHLPFPSEAVREQVYRWTSYVLGLLEDGGEMILASFLVWVVVQRVLDFSEATEA